MLTEYKILIRRANFRRNGPLLVVSKGENIAIRIKSLCYVSAITRKIQVLFGNINWHSNGYAPRHLMEQPALATCATGPLPVAATARMASNRSLRASAGAVC